MIGVTHLFTVVCVSTSSTVRDFAIAVAYVCLSASVAHELYKFYNNVENEYDFTSILPHDAMHKRGLCRHAVSTGASTPYKRWSKCSMEKVGGERFCRNLGGKCINY